MAYTDFVNAEKYQNYRKVNLLRCPFCGAPARLFIQFDLEDGEDPESHDDLPIHEHAVLIRCSGCGIQTPLFEEKGDNGFLCLAAAEYWNNDKRV